MAQRTITVNVPTKAEVKSKLSGLLKRTAERLDKPTTEKKWQWQSPIKRTKRS